KKKLRRCPALATVDKQLEEKRKWRRNAILPVKDARKDETGMLANYLGRDGSIPFSFK
ncbi:hypothetical protein K0M31_003229, partial [Melipona bicolor]